MHLNINSWTAPGDAMDSSLGYSYGETYKCGLPSVPVFGAEDGHFVELPDDLVRNFHLQ